MLHCHPPIFQILQSFNFPIICIARVKTMGYHITDQNWNETPSGSNVPGLRRFTKRNKSHPKNRNDESEMNEY